MILLAIYIAVMFKAAKAYQRDSAQKLCVASLIILLVFLIVNQLGGVFINVMDASSSTDESSLSMWLGLIFVLIALVVLPAAMLMAIIGIVLYIKKRDQYSHGIGHAISTLVMSCVAILVLGFIFAQSFKQEFGDGVFSEMVSSLSTPTVTQIHVASIGIDAPLTDGPWYEWVNLAEDAPEAIAGALHEDGAGLYVQAVSLDGLSVSDQELANGILRNWGQTYPSTVVKAMGKSPIGGEEGFYYSFFRNDGPDDQYWYEIHIVRSENLATAFIFWINSNDEKAITQLARRETRHFHFAAPSNEPLPNSMATSSASWLNYMGVAAYEKQRYDQAAKLYRAAYDAQTQTVFATNLIETYGQLRDHQKGIAVAREHLANTPNDRSVRAELGYQLYDKEQYDEALKQYAIVYASDDPMVLSESLDPEYFNQYIELLRSHDRYVFAEEQIQRMQPALSISQHATLLSKVKRDLEQWDEAIAVIDEAIGKAPPPLSLLLEKISVLRDASRPKQGWDLAQKLIEDGYRSWDVYFYQGLCELDMDWYPQAHASFETAHDKAQIDLTKEYLDHSASMLGQGDNTLVRDPVQPVAIPASVARAIEQLRNSDGYAALDLSDEDTVCLQHLTGLYYKADEPFRKTLFRTYQINTDTSAENYQSLTFDFDGQYERIHVNELVVHDMKGQEIGRGNLDQYFVVDADQDGLHDNDKTLTIPVPGIKAPCVLTYKISYETLADIEEPPFEQFTQVVGNPTRHWGVFITGELSDLTTHAQNGLTEKTAANTRWVLNAQPPQYFWESMQPSFDEQFATWTLGAKPTEDQSNTKAWESLAEAYLSDLSAHLAPIALPQAVLDQAFAGLPVDASQAQIIRHAMSFVQNNLTYEGIEFGVRGRIPHTIDEIVSQRFGDCKDHSLLLYQLLHSEKVPAKMALVNTGSDIVKTVPSLNQFDHMIVVVPKAGNRVLDEWHILDATNKTHSPLGGTANYLRDKQILILDPDANHFFQTPKTDPKQQKIELDRRVTIRSNGTLDVHETLTLYSDAAEYMRDHLTPVTPKDQLQTVSNMLADYGVRVRTVEIGNLKDLDKPLTISLSYETEFSFEKANAQWAGKIPNHWQRYYLEAKYTPNRRTALEISWPVHFSTQSRVLLPKDAHWLAGLEGASIDGNEFADATASVSIQANELLIKTNVTLKTGIHPAERYTAYESSMRRFIKPGQPTLRYTVNP